ncbi:unnamed protein product [Sphagnum troendelagicum]|uniref:Uncharacterized protein n=2 Tax=Sphagnum TaxID=13804 RepID=A0ABP0TTI6_9BRYO|nr:hypothetical protein BDL97_14G078900 [Sphagnum fallax]KAH9541688.1 hypothetical protein CY35_14G078500 [Sphagnum magellanicum]
MMGFISRIMIVILLCSLLVFPADSRKIRRVQLLEHTTTSAFAPSSSASVQTAVYEREGLEESTKLTVENFPDRSKAHSFSQDDRFTQPTPSGPSRGHNSVPTP